MGSSKLTLLRLFGAMFLVLFALNPIQVVTADRIVFVHGFIGFGPDELLGVGYWGFPKIFGSSQDYVNQMRSRGHQVFYASVGPLSSNWDRACELYAQIKGTRVDYGAAHSQKHGHARFGKDYTGRGFFPGWDSNNKISFIGHSMGGNTIRMLEYLLQKGSAEEIQAAGDSASLLFRRSKPGGNNWIHSIHTLSSPHDGTTSIAMGESFLSFSKITLLSYGAVAGINTLNVDWLYDFDLEQFGLDRKPQESFESYFNRVFDSPALKPNFVDNAIYDLSVDACAEFNNMTELTYPGTYYFAYSTGQTHVCSFSGDHCPDIDMEVFLAPTAFIMGRIGPNTCTSTGYCFNKAEWAENDGVVPTRSSRGPQLGVRKYVPVAQRPTKCSLFKCQYDNSKLAPEVWYNAHVRRDHTQIIGLRLNLLEPIASSGVYNDIADAIEAIKSPASSSNAQVFENGFRDSEEVNPAAIAVPVTVGFLLLTSLTVAVIRRRRQQQVDGPEKTSSMRSTSKDLDEIAKRASIVGFSSASSSNPAFENQVHLDPVALRL